MKHIAFCLLSLMMLPLCGMAEEQPAYEIILPASYETSQAAYPAVYILPQDAGCQDDGGLTALLKQEMEKNGTMETILVRPMLDPAGDLAAQLRAVTADVDANYRTMADRAHRALVGTGAGGYLAYALGLDGGEFAALMSIRGDFSGQDHPFKKTYGDVYDRIELMHMEDAAALDNFYTYMDAPVDDAYTLMQGSTAELGALFIGFGTGSAAHEFTLRPGAFDRAFLGESMSRILGRLKTYMGMEEAAPALPLAVYETDAPCMVDGDQQKIDLGGGWRFCYSGAKRLDAAALTEEATKDWQVVHPAVGNWTKGYANISEENVVSHYGPDYFDYFITENGYYVRSFIIPQEFDSCDVMLSIGYVDDRCEVFVNGVRVGATGMDESGKPTGDTTWAQYSAFEIDASLLVYGGLNTVVVRAYNDLPFGAGGWYAGPVGLYSRAAFEKEIGFGGAGEHARFYEETFLSAYAAKARGSKEPQENPYLIYLPEDYFTSGKRYPTMILLHQFNSDHTSYKADKIDQLMDAGVRSGAFDGMIVVIPNSSEESWWKGDWEKMIVEELIPHIDANYRTIPDARFRLTAGCSMGGQGAMSVALRNPDCFTGAVSFYGAFSYGGALSPNAIADSESALYMDSFSLAFICGNQDSYGFGVPAVSLHSQLARMDVPHYFLIENGGHDSSFYKPYFNDCLSFVRADMYKADEGVKEILSAELTVDGGAASVRVSALDAADAYFHRPLPSGYTKAPVCPLHVPLTLIFTQEGRSVSVQRTGVFAAAGDHCEWTVDLPQEIDADRPYEIALYADVLGVKTALLTN